MGSEQPRKRRSDESTRGVRTFCALSAALHEEVTPCSVTTSHSARARAPACKAQAAAADSHGAFPCHYEKVPVRVWTLGSRASSPGTAYDKLMPPRVDKQGRPISKLCPCVPCPWQRLLLTNDCVCNNCECPAATGGALQNPGFKRNTSSHFWSS